MSEEKKDRLVDQSAIRVNQAFIIALLIIAFILDIWLLVAFVSLVMLLGTALPKLSLFKGIYQRLLRPAGWVKPDIIQDNPEPHLFAQGFGGVVLAMSVAAILLGLNILGWVLAWIVIVLASLNLFLGFCAGCFLYYQLNKLHIPGFKHGPINSTSK